MTGRDKEPRELFGPFVVFERLGMGGTASVFRAQLARQDGTQLEVSLKRLHPHLACDRRAVQEFVHEARVARLMQHQNISRFYEIGRLGSDYFIATEYIEGTDLGKLLGRAAEKRRPPPLSATLSLLVQLCDALDYAHNRTDEHGKRLEFVHRDISPSNLIVAPEGVLKLIDMGIAKSAARKIQTETGIIKGKLGYMAPEVVAGEIADRSADIFAIGVVAWEMLTASRLFGGGSESDTLERLQRGATEPPSSRNPACPARIDAIVMRALAKQSSERWPSAGAMGRAFRAAAATLHEPLSPDAIATWARSLGDVPTPDDNGTGTDSDVSIEIEVVDETGEPTELETPTPRREQTTLVHRRLEPTMPRRPIAFPDGTGQLPLAPPDPSVVAPLPEAIPRPRSPRLDSTAAVNPLPYEDRRPSRAARVRRVLAGILGASLVANVVLIIGLSQRGDVPDTTSAKPVAHPDPSRLFDPATEPDPIPIPVPIPAPPPAEPEPPPIPTARQPSTLPANGLPLVPFEDLHLRYARHPASRSTQEAYAARICLDRRGRVDSVQAFEGPERLFRRIERNLRRWRFRPYLTGDHPTPVCTIVREHLRDWDKHRKRRR